MGQFKDVLDLLKKGSRHPIDKIKNVVDKNNYSVFPKSFAKGAADGTFQFPTIFVDTISILTCETITALTERVNASFVQTVMSLNSNMNISDTRNASAFLKKFHRNMKLESVQLNDEGTICLEYSSDIREKRFVLQHMRKLMDGYDEGFITKPFDNISDSPVYENDGTSDDTISAEDLISMQITGAMNADAEKFNDTKYLHGYKSRLDNKAPFPTLTPSEIKKLNNMQPYTIQVRLHGINDEDEFVEFIDVVIGVKSTTHAMKSSQVIDFISKTMTTSSPILKFVQWTSGEISFFKDIVLQLKDMRFNAQSLSKEGLPWLGTLKRMSRISTAQQALFNNTGFVPNATLVLTEYEVDEIKTKCGYDLSDIDSARKLMNKLFLMSFMIVDNARGTVDILYDSSYDFNSYSLETLEKEVNNNSAALGKEITRMISR